jgi:hypothetical protein
MTEPAPEGKVFQSMRCCARYDSCLQRSYDHATKIKAVEAKSETDPRVVRIRLKTTEAILDPELSITPI